ncbi:MAG: phosphatidylglycerophosphate synthase [Candidatus Omnitrophota bacterium]|jgi:phosphatidylglycerophosphate synthase
MLLRTLTRLGIRPNWVTFLGLGFSVGAGYCLGVGRIQLAVVPFAFAGVCDVLDGRLARYQNSDSAMGALLDSVVDRYSDFCYFFGLCVYFVGQGRMVLAAFAISALLAAVCISYIRARSHSLGYLAGGGYWERPERMIVIGFGMLLLNPAMIVILLGLLAHLTAFQRLLDANRGLNSAHGAVEGVKNRYSFAWVAQTLCYVLVLTFFRP